MKNKFFKLYYNPKIIGAKNIPSNGPVILCGNHLNPLDYKLVSCATKRNIVWYKQNNLEEVKKELKNNGIVGIFPEKVINIYRLLQIDIMLLEQEINKINSCKYMRGTECMNEVARIRNKIGLKLQEIDLIKNQLSLSGISVKDFDVILPFNDDAIKLSNEYSALIVPFALTNDYSFRSNNLKVIFGKSCTISDNNMDKEILENKVRKLIYKNY